jgi:hypothetical protein
MFNSKNVLFSIVTVLFLSAFINAQTVGFNFNTAIPTGEFGDAVNFGFSGGVSFHFPVAGFVGVASGEYGFWNEKEEGFSFSNFPVVFAGARKYFGDFYGSVLAGFYPVKLKVEVEGQEIQEAKETQGAIVPGFGYVFPVSSFDVDASASFLWTQDYSQVRFGVSFLFNR